jgi:DNA/RNA endonuclease YhcR with UshA esterase domain|tara:strand:+ start:4201 stop:4356 length:156 start_codon:yes stop_codon:yes gene_type:complete
MTTKENNKTREAAEYQGWLNIYRNSPDAAAQHPKHSQFLRKYNSQSKLTIK